MRKMRKTKILSQLSKTALLDMKWKNRDISVPEQANIPKFSKLDDMRLNEVAQS